MPYEKLFSLTPGRNRILYMEEIPVDGLTSADAVKLKDKVYTMMEKKIIEYKGAWRISRNPGSRTNP
jgi:1-acyl-sn-glycerol-3-phosphate acyltransferase